MRALARLARSLQAGQLPAAVFETAHRSSVQRPAFAVTITRARRNAAVRRALAALLAPGPGYLPPAW